METTIKKIINGKEHVFEIHIAEDIHRSIGEKGCLRWGYKHNGEHKDGADGGWFGGRDYSDGVLYFWHQKIDGKSVDGLLVADEELRKQLDELKASLVKSWEEGKERIVNDLIDGKEEIAFSIVGCDYKYYQPWVASTRDSETFDAQDIMERACDKLLSSNGITPDHGSICDFLGNLVGTSPRRATELPPYAHNPRHDPRDGYKEFIVSTWTARLGDILAEYIEKEIVVQKHTDKKNEEYKATLAEMGRGITVVSKHRFTCEDEDGTTEGIEYTVKYKNKTYIYTVRNIFDFGLAINPNTTGGGLAMNVEEFIKTNKYTFSLPEAAEEYRKSHQTPTGWGWNTINGWKPMDEDEVKVYLYVSEIIPHNMHGVRT
ncbi:MAG: hypothetical protein M0024_10525 [Nitrospiraceae bacterium]|nr:hypothetical protein [Nitrospiraceae bacterium]